LFSTPLFLIFNFWYTFRTSPVENPTSGVGFPSVTYGFG
jgi:hypothetical protein